MKFDIFITGEIENEKSTEIIKELIKLKNQAIINIFINSDGGSLTDIFAVVDFIKFISSVTRVYIFGACHLSVTLIALSCTTCYMSTNATMVFHFPFKGQYKKLIDNIIDERVDI